VGHRLVVDARAAGVGVAIMTIALRMPFLVTVAAAVITTAAVRALF
jgi:hypothetical protein